MTPDQMRAADAAAIEQCGIPSAILMENAARSAADIIRSDYLQGRERRRLLILCGPGNNGGDGFALARHLAGDADVRVGWFGSPDNMSAESRTNFDILSAFGIPPFNIADAAIPDRELFGADIVVDAMLGTGGGAQLRDPLPDILKAVNATRAVRVALDLPTGLDGLTGAAHPHAFCADCTITMSAAKRGMYFGRGPELCGEIRIASIGAPPDQNAKQGGAAILEKNDLRRLLPPRRADSSKFDYGRILVLGGSAAMPGAIALSANAAIRAGAGLVTLFTTDVHPAVRPEIMLRRMAANDEGGISGSNFDAIRDELQKSDVILIGPGLGRSADTLALVAALLPEISAEQSCILDADALAVWPDYGGVLPHKLICTPHIGEFARALDQEREQVAKQRERFVREWLGEIGGTLLLKGVPTIIVNRERQYLNIGGNPGMATAGSGDVLAGIIAAMAGRGLAPLEAAALGAWIHSCAGDAAMQVHGVEGLTASTVIEHLDAVFVSATQNTNDTSTARSLN